MALQKIMMNDANTFDALIIGGGPAGLTTSIYLSRAGFKNGYIEKNIPGGKIVNIDLIKNYPGFNQIKGADLALRMYSQVESLGGVAIFGNVNMIDQHGDYHVVYCDGGGTWFCKSLIIATGVAPKKIECENADYYLNKGISYCVVCDGNLAKNCEVCIVGNDNITINNIIYLSNIASKISIINEYPNFDTSNSKIKELLSLGKIKIFNEAYIKKINGDKQVINSIDINQKNTSLNIPCKFVYISKGQQPQTEFIKYKDLCDNKGYIINNLDMSTSIPGLFSAGDCNHESIKQITSAIGQATVAALSAINYLNSKK